MRVGCFSLFSARGRVVPEIGSPDIREIFVKSYRLIYKIEETRGSWFWHWFMVPGI